MLPRINPLRLLLLGAPGSGKGTQTKKLKKLLPNILAISSGDLLREQVTKRTKLGKEVLQYIERGELVPDGLISRFVTAQLLKTKSESAQEQVQWLLDGFPRNLDQARSFQNTLRVLNMPLSNVIELKVPKSRILERLASRYIHEASGRTYNLSYNPPKTPGVDDLTGDPLVKRVDDSQVGVITRRLDDYDKFITPLRNYYNELGILSTVSGDTSDEIFPQILQVLNLNAAPAST
ncbi:hypothetical protein KAFR_0B02560 [Kazachstania africana CBS 2517]|uniref:Adenylate kinase active site lid domain-containing protein n=1 Tax=Kazachstania africana (strain ATCC 22294 / BCRC 22015 / CBS 2517 / CECT 1963 / NBRC 1671 / NRRL Y-8276) TaxID=1071382 RepID=H2AQA3_KAZAF|nr:hypothetical protein KAFR_0B02560 [Kazachstania africana CBS 2517]CCF56553.1 hypothetical protein KAFR_0B02560 [Kazachstania africana CBS 2517]